jgi:hypothetical protein
VRAGRRPLLDHGDLAKVERVLRRGLRASGYATEIWTLPRITEVIAELTGVSYHPGHVWRLMGQLGWSSQRPVRQAAERDDEAVDEWVSTRWTWVKKRPSPGCLDRLRGRVGHLADATSATDLATAARRCAPSSTRSDPGWSSSDYRPTPPISTRSKRSEETSRASSWPTSASTLWQRPTTTHDGAFGAAGGRRTWRSHSCTTPVLPYDQNVTVLCETKPGSTV